MADLFVDTAGWGHLVDQSQEHHGQAAAIYRTARQQQRGIITTNYILTELVALLTSPLRIPRPQIVAFINGLKMSPHIEIVHVNPTLAAQAWQLLTQRQDKTWSLVDCSSFVIMQERGISEALTTDHHFEQAGFIKLLS
jgi:uncharacterized protein